MTTNGEITLNEDDDDGNGNDNDNDDDGRVDVNLD